MFMQSMCIFKLYLRNEQTRRIHMNDLNVGPALCNILFNDL